MYLPQKALSFAYDQARDAFVAQEIISGDLKILGPSVSGVPWLYHGVLYYYVIAPFYLLGNGNPVFVSFCLGFINSLFVFVVYLLATNMLKNKLFPFIPALLFAFSFEQTQYAVWLSNPAMGVWFVTLLYVVLYLWIKKRKTVFLGITGLAYGLSIQSNFSLIYHIIPITLWIWYSKKYFKLKNTLVFCTFLLIAILSMVLVEFKFGFKSLEGIKHLISPQSIDMVRNGFGNVILSYFYHMDRVFSYNIFPTNLIIGGILALLIITFTLYMIRDKNYKFRREIIFLLFWVLSYSVAAILSGSNIPHITSGIGVGVIFLAAFFIWELSLKNKYIALILLFIIVLSNVSKITTENIKGQTIFAIQKDMTLKNELELVDYTYKKSNGYDFSINTLTSPLFINTTWSYLYNWYGIQKYGYTPFWLGRDQVGSLGNNLENAKNNVDKHFYIIEDMEGIPSKYLSYGLGEEDSRSKIIGEEIFGKHIVQERLLNPY